LRTDDDMEVPAFLRYGTAHVDPKTFDPNP